MLTNFWKPFLQTEDKTVKNRKLEKKKHTPLKNETEDESVKSDQASVLNASSQVDEYDQDTSDEEVRWLTRVFTFY